MRMFLLLLICFLSPGLIAQEVITIESTVTGSQEQPKVLSIVPWRQVEDPEYFGGEIVGLGQLTDVFEPISRESFNRERRYIETIRKSE